MVADGVHILLSLALVMGLLRSSRAEPYLVTALAAAVPDIDIVVFPLLVELGYVDGVLWSHRGVTHSLLAGVIVVGLLAPFGPWRAAAIGYGSHLLFDCLTGGVQLFAPVDRGLYGLSLDWALLNFLTSAVAVTVLLGGLLCMKYDFTQQVTARRPNWGLERFR